MKYLESGPMVFGGTGFGKKVTLVCSNKACQGRKFSLRPGHGALGPVAAEWRCDKCDSKAEEVKDE